jgi:hypothetical protein
MHTWYRAVCDEHKEMCHVLVTSTFHIRSELYLNDEGYYGDDKSGNIIVKWLSKHYECNLRLVHQDSDLDGLWDEYTDVRKMNAEAGTA